MLNNRDLIPVVILLCQVFAVHTFIGKFIFCGIPFKLLLSAKCNVSHLRNPGHVCANVDGSIQLLHFTGTHHANKIQHVAGQSIIGRFLQRLFYFPGCILFRDHFPPTAV